MSSDAIPRDELDYVVRNAVCDELNALVVRLFWTGLAFFAAYVGVAVVTFGVGAYTTTRALLAVAVGCALVLASVRALYIIWIR